ncbi:hypothetical protein L9F63_011463, partial [Diploptera punctata]
CTVSESNLKEIQFTTLDKTLKPIMLTLEQRVELVLLCRDNYRTLREAADEFHRRHPEISKPSFQT